MSLQYGQVLHYLPDFLLGAAMALWIAALAFAGGLLIGLFGAAVLTQGPLWMRLPKEQHIPPGEEARRLIRQNLPGGHGS
ncbi:MAG: hypothetical protein ACK5NZ_00765, partial [bacterium]